jgi:hypothetical protein
MLLAEKEFPISTITTKKKDRVRHAVAGARQRNI